MPPRRLLISLCLIFVTMAAGIAVRFAPLRLPSVATKYAGSMLWAAMIYWIVSTVSVSRPPLMAALAAGLFATAVEFFKLYHAPGLDAFRLTLPGILLLGRVFSFSAIAAYGVAIALAALLDARFFRRQPTTKNR